MVHPVVSVQLSPHQWASVRLKDVFDFGSIEEKTRYDGDERYRNERGRVNFYFWASDKRAVRVGNSQELATALRLPPKYWLEGNTLKLHVLHDDVPIHTNQKFCLPTITEKDDEMNLEEKKLCQLKDIECEGDVATTSSNKEIEQHVNEENNRRRSLPCLQTSPLSAQYCSQNPLAALASGGIQSFVDLQACLRQITRRYHYSSYTLLEYTIERMSSSTQEHFFTSLLPFIARTVLRDNSPPSSLQHSVFKLTRERSLSLLANAFLCTFTTSTNPSHRHLSLHSLFGGDMRVGHMFCSAQKDTSRAKILSLLNYFNTMQSNDSLLTETLTIRRKVAPSEAPCYEHSSALVRPSLAPNLNSLLHATQSFIALDSRCNQPGIFALQLGTSVSRCDIAYFEFPELLLLPVFNIQPLDVHEAIVIDGVKRFSLCGIIDGLLRFNQPVNNIDSVKSIVFVDAGRYSGDATEQFRCELQLRELNKAAAGYSLRPQSSVEQAVAVGGWGIDVKRGDISLKFLLQAMAAAAVGEQIVFYDDGDGRLQQFSGIIQILHKKRVSVAKIWRFLRSYRVSYGRVFVELVDYLNQHV